MKANSTFFSRVVFSLFLMCVVLPVSRAVADESAYDRVIRTNTIRCGYAVWPGLVEKDPNTGALSGLFVDFMEEVGRVTELKIEWAGEYGFGDFIEALNSHKIDAMCAGVWTNALRGKFVLFSDPIAYQTIVPIVRADDNRLDGGIDKLNDPQWKIVVADGESAITIATSDFPKATLLSLPQRTEAAVMIANVVNKKADITFVDVFTALDFQSKNPGRIKVVQTPFPVRVFGLPLNVSKSEFALKSLLDTASRQLLWVGAVEKLIRKHERFPGAFLRAQLPFVASSNAPNTKSDQ